MHSQSLNGVRCVCGLKKKENIKKRVLGNEYSPKSLRTLMNQSDAPGGVWAVVSTGGVINQERQTGLCVSGVCV